MDAPVTKLAVKDVMLRGTTKYAFVRVSGLFRYSFSGLTEILLLSLLLIIINHHFVNIIIAPCLGFDAYESMCHEPDFSLESNTCMALVKTEGSTCAAYCEGQGSFCVRAQDNTNSDQCTRDESHDEGCDEEYNDQICVCQNMNSYGKFISYAV